MAASSLEKNSDGKGEFDCPCGVAIDSAGRVYVAAVSENHHIQVFTREGESLGMSGILVQVEGNWMSLLVIDAVDPSGFVYVGENGNHHVSVFTSEGCL